MSKDEASDLKANIDHLVAMKVEAQKAAMRVAEAESKIHNQLWRLSQEKK